MAYYDDYENFISSLILDIKRVGRNIKNIGCGRLNKVIGVSGQKHQIDVSFIDYSFEEPTLILIECKLSTKSIGVSVSKIIKATLDDILAHSENPDKGIAILVASSKYQSGTLLYSNYYGIKTESVSNKLSYKFKYENIVLNALNDSVNVIDTIKIGRKCSSCGENLSKKQDTSYYICPKCNIKF